MNTERLVLRACLSGLSRMTYNVVKWQGEEKEGI